MPDTLYYDGQCPLCVSEMDRLRRLKGPELSLRDIHALDTELDHDVDTHTAATCNTDRPDRDTLLRVLHLERDGVFLTGVDANVAAWQHTRFGWLWRWMTWPLLRPVVEIAYNRWARWRYDRLYSQGINAKQPAASKES